ncbi:MAG: DUF3891 family protein [Leptolyngbyaceae bacterium]|nr:DUF3891 family protein [Leptolyngbyaceae bacterium]
MIVNLRAEGWEVIYHRSHALLAAQIAGNWDHRNVPQRLYETIAAISHHDDLEKEWEGNQLTDVGAPLDFRLQGGTSVDQLKKLTDEALYRSRWVAMLISMHVCYLNQAKRGSCDELDAFLDEQEKRQVQWRKELDVTQDKAESSYAFLEWCDRLSLILCQRQVPMGKRSLEVSSGPSGHSYYLVERDDGSLNITPWPFVPNEFMVNVEACYLSQLEFASSEELASALKNSPRKILSWNFKRDQE